MPNRQFTRGRLPLPHGRPVIKRAAQRLTDVPVHPAPPIS